jgi:hypothetical protein
VGGPECPAEVRAVGETPGGGDGRHRTGRQRRIGEIAPTPFQPPLPDVAGDRQALVVEELVQRAQGHVVGRRDSARGQPRITQLLVNEALHGGEQGMPVGLGRSPRAELELMGQTGRQDLQCRRGERTASAGLYRSTLLAS